MGGDFTAQLLVVEARRSKMHPRLESWLLSSILFHAGNCSHNDLFTTSRLLSFIFRLHLECNAWMKPWMLMFLKSTWTDQTKYCQIPHLIRQNAIKKKKGAGRRVRHGLTAWFETWQEGTIDSYNFYKWMIACVGLTNPRTLWPVIRKMRPTYRNLPPQCEVTGSWSISKSLDRLVTKNKTKIALKMYDAFIKRQSDTVKTLREVN